MSFNFAMHLSANLRYLGQLLLPFSYEQGVILADPAAWGGRDFNDVSYRGLYMGAVPVVLAALAVWRHRRWPWPGWALLALALTGTALALGKQTPLYPALWSLPIFGSLRFPYRFLAISAVCIASLAGLGLSDTMASKLESRSDDVASRDHGVKNAIPLLAVLGLAIAGAGYLWVSRPSWMILSRDFERGTLISLALVAVACLLVFGASVAGGHFRRMLCVSLIVFTLGDLWWFRERSGYAPTLKVEEVMTSPRVAKFLTRNDKNFRIMSLEGWEMAGPRKEAIFEFAHVHANALWGLDSADPYESLMLRRYFMVHEALSWELLNTPASASRLQGYLGALNIKYIIAPSLVFLKGWKKVYESPRANVWQNPAVLPRAFLVGRVKPEHIEERDEWVDRARKRQGRYPNMIPDWRQPYVADSQIVDNILSGTVDYAKTAIVAGSDLPRLEVADLQGIVVGGPADSDLMRFSVATEQPSFLVISSNYYPGWTATVNGEPATIYRTNWVMSGVFVPAGRTEVVLQFTTPGLRTGLAVTLVMVVLLAGFALAWVRKQSAQSHPNA